MGNMARTSKLTPRQQRFIDEYLVDLNGKQAAIRAGYSPNGAEVTASKLLSHAKVGSAVAAAKAKRAERVQVDQDWVLRQWKEIAEADPRDLVQYQRGPCEECWEDGGHEAPNPECGKCAGHGHGHVILADTRELSPGAARLYAGVQLGREGIKVNMRSQDGALENVARHLGMFKDSLELKGGIAVTISQDDAKL